MADHRVATGGTDLVRAAASLALAPEALAPAIRAAATAAGQTPTPGTRNAI